MSVDKIEILSLELFQRFRVQMDIVERIQRFFNMGIGWHYYLDLAWLVNVVKELPKGSLLLDAGAGSGLTQFILAELGFNVISTDFANRQFPKQILQRYEPIIHYLNDQSVVFDNVYTRHLESTYRLKVDGKKTKGNYPNNPETVKQFIENHRFKPLTKRKEKLSSVLKENAADNCGRIFIYKSDLKNMFLIPDNFVEGVISISALEHNDHNGLEQCITELLRVTKKGGFLAVTVSASLADDWFHEQSKGWCYSETTLKKFFQLPESVNSNYADKDKLFSKLKKENNELHKRLAPFYFKSGDNGMPWGKWNPKYLPVGILKVNRTKVAAGLETEQKPHISIIMPNYNYASYVGEAIESVIAQTYKNWELIIVDDGSTDDSVAIIDRYKAKEPQRIIPIYKQNGGQASAFNAGFSKCRGDIVCFLDSDDYWFPNKLERILQAHEQNDFVQHNLMKGDQKYRVFKYYENHLELMTKKGLFDFFVPTTGLTFKRRVLEQIFPLPEPDLKICADAYITRMALYFSKLKILDEVLGYYRVHASNTFFNNLQKKNTGIIFDILDVVNNKLQEIGKPMIPFKGPSRKTEHMIINGNSYDDSVDVQVSIVIPTYNRLDFIIRTLDSIEGLNYPIPDFEVIVVDDGSTDCTKEYLEKYSKTTGLNFRYITQKNSGPATARNTGLKYARGKFVAYTDSDCIVDKNWLNELLKGFTSENIVGVGGSARGVGDDIYSRYFGQTGMYSTRIIDNIVTYLLTLNACYRREIILSFGGFNENFRSQGGEDPDLSFRLRKKGYLLGYNPNAIVYHHHKNNALSFFKTFRSYGRGQALLVKLHPEWYNEKNIRNSYRGITAMRFYRACRKKGFGRKDSFILSVLRCAQDFILYGYMFKRQKRIGDMQITPIPWEKKSVAPPLPVAKTVSEQEPKEVSLTEKPEHMNVVIPFHKGDQTSAKVLLELLMVVEEGIDTTYYLQYGHDPATLTIKETLSKFQENKNAHFSTELPDIKVPDQMINQDPNTIRYPEYDVGGPNLNPWWILPISKFKIFQWNLCIFKYINKLDSFLIVEPDAVVLKRGWLRDIYEGWKNDDGPIFGHLKKGKIKGQMIPTHWAGSSVYDCIKLRKLPLEKYFYERYPNPWWKYITAPNISFSNNCFWGPVFSGYDISYDYFLFGLYWKETTGFNEPEKWQLDQLNSHEDLIICDWHSKLKPMEVFDRYAGKLSMFHGLKEDDTRELMLNYFLAGALSAKGNTMPEHRVIAAPSELNPHPNEIHTHLPRRSTVQPQTQQSTKKKEEAVNIIRPAAAMDTDLWKFKDIHYYKRIFIMGSGPSLNKMDLNKLEGEYVFCSNAIFLLFPRIKWRPTYYTCVDTRVLPDRKSEIIKMHEENPNMICFFPKSIVNHQTGAVTPTETIISPSRNRVYFEQKPLFMEDKSFLDELPFSAFSVDAYKFLIQPFTVTVTMLQLAVFMGFEPIYLIGCDTDYKVPQSVIQDGELTKQGKMFFTSTVDDDPNHFSPDYFGKGRKWHNPQVDNMIWHYKMSYEMIRILGRHAYNATVGGKLEVFPRVNFEELF